MRTTWEDVMVRAFFTFIGLLIAAVVVGGVWFAVASYNHEAVQVCKVEDKDRTRTEDGSDMRVYTDCGNFKVEDALFKGNFHSSDTYRSLKRGHTYELHTIGFRIPFLSEFPNILEAREVER